MTAPPRHIAIIMDGNGRWAQERGLPRYAGHRAGAKAVNRTVRACRQMGIEQLTLYAFSEQNWARPEDEVGALMQLLCDYVHEEWQEILDNGIRLTTIGDISRLPAFVRHPLEALVAASQDNQGMVLALALSYGSREEIVRGVQALAESVRAGTLDPADIDADAIGARLYTGGRADPDLIIRTCGEHRLSNFLLWQAAYAEFYFTDVLWPDFDVDALEDALASYCGRERRFGLTTRQVARSA